MFKNKKVLLGFILGVFVTSIISVGAVSLIYSKDVTYDNSTSGLKSTTVQGALDELYESAKNAPTCNSEGECTVTCPSGTILVPTLKGYKCSPGKATSELTKNGGGIYADSLESGRYIYRGSTPNNYITFNNETWRIISLESDGTLKIMKQDKIGRYSWDAANNRSNTGYCKNAHVGCSSWGSKTTIYNSSGTKVTGMPRIYNSGNYELPSNIATLNEYLNETYYNSLSSEAKSKIVLHYFNVGPVAATSSDLTIKNDVSSEKEYQWKGYVALFNASDFVRASLNSNCTGVYAYSSISNCYEEGQNNWMFVYAGGSEWTLTPVFDESTYFVWGFWTNGNYSYLHSSSASNDENVRPVVFLSADTKLFGTGSSSDPYKIVS